MVQEIFHIYIYFNYLFVVYASAQEAPVKKDSTTIYKNIESYSKQSKFKTFIYRLVFKPAHGTRKKEVKKKGYKKLIQKPYSAFEGKTIRNINIVTLDPLATQQTTLLPENKISLTKAGNGLHIKTQGITIRNLFAYP